MSDTIRLEVPDIGDYDGVDVVEVFVKPGDAVAVEDPLVTLETDKATMEVPATAAGVVQEVLVAVGDKVGKGTPLVLLEAKPATNTAAEAAPAPSAPAPVAPPAAAPPSPPAAPPAAVEQPPAAAEPRSAAPAHASPSVRRFARELGVDVGRVTGSGPKGRILHADVQAFVKAVMADALADALAGAPPAPGAAAALPPWPEIDFAKFGPVETQPLGRIRRLSAGNLARNWVAIPHVTQFDEADITDTEAFRRGMAEELQAQNVKLTLLAFLVKAAVSALRAFPGFNASLRGDELVLKRYFHVGFAADTANGLVVPVIRDADRKSLLDIAGEAASLAAKAREGRLAAADMQGGCFTISSLGGIGGTAFTPIINAPEVAILGVSKAATKPVWDGTAFVPRLMLPLSLSYDHRVIDGALAARFTTHLGRLLGDVRRLLL